MALGRGDGGADVSAVHGEPTPSSRKIIAKRISLPDWKEKKSPEIARRGPGRGGWVGSEGAEVTSAVEGQLEAREPDL